MATIEYADDIIRVEAATLARAFGITERDLKQGMRDGTVTSRVERGEDEDAGKVRLTFFSADRRVRMTADQSGRLLSCTAADFARPAASQSAPGDHTQLDALLDIALDGTFPASDPIAVSVDRPHEAVSGAAKPRKA